MSYTEVLQRLLRESMVALLPAKIPQPPFHRGYDPNLTCAYHSGVQGHSTENCMALKYKVQSLIDAGWLEFKEVNPSVGTNPLTNHGGPSVSVVDGEV